MESAQVFVLFTNDDEVYAYYADSKTPVKIADGVSTEDAFATYASSRRSLIFHNKNNVTVRRDLNKVFFLQTAFGGEINSENDDRIIEMPVQELTEWVKYFSNIPKRFEECSEIKNFASILNQVYSTVDQTQSFKNLTVKITVPKCKELFIEFDNMAKKIIQDDKTEFPLFPLYFWLIERLRWALNCSHPYHIQNTQQSSKLIDVSVMNSEAARVLSFYKWPHMNFQHALPSRLAETGFFFQPGQIGDDRVVCFSCKISLITWEANDEPM